MVTDRGVWHCATAVVASGACVRPAVPGFAAALSPTITSLTPMEYRNPQQLAEGPVLVVGAAATGVQLAEEIHASGRPVTLSVGEHVRMPRLYRGRDIFWWMERAGILNERLDQLDDVVRARHLASPQLIGTSERRSIDLTSLQAAGVRIVGRIGRIRDGVAQFSGGLENVCKLADLKLNRLLVRLDEAATEGGFDGDVDASERFAPTRAPSTKITEIDLGGEGIRTVLWATGFRADHRWIDLPVFDHAGCVRHDGGVVRDAPGVYVLGLNVLRRRRSSFIAGAVDDTADLAAHLHAHLGTAVRTRR